MCQRIRPAHMSSPLICTTEAVWRECKNCWDGYLQVLMALWRQQCPSLRSATATPTTTRIEAGNGTNVVSSPDFRSVSTTDCSTRYSVATARGDCISNSSFMTIDQLAHWKKLRRKCTLRSSNSALLLRKKPASASPYRSCAPLSPLLQRVSGDSWANSDCPIRRRQHIRSGPVCCSATKLATLCTAAMRAHSVILRFLITKNNCARECLAATQSRTLVAADMAGRYRETSKLSPLAGLSLIGWHERERQPLPLACCCAPARWQP